jgi:hypothetical protein
MLQIQKTMTLEEKLAIGMKAHESMLAGDTEGYFRIAKQVPIPPYLAKIFKEKVGVDFLRNSGLNLAEAEAEFGSGWLDN